MTTKMMQNTSWVCLQETGRPVGNEEQVPVVCVTFMRGISLPVVVYPKGKPVMGCFQMRMKVLVWTKRAEKRDRIGSTSQDEVDTDT